MAATGFIVNGVCYSTSADAANAYFSSQPASMTAGGTSYENLYMPVGGVWKLYQYSINGFGTYTLRSSANAVVPTFPACDPAMGFNDGMTLGWGVVAAMAMAWAFTLMRRAAR